MPYFHTVNSAIAAGFSLIPGRNTLMTHPKWPGFLFKIISGYKEAVSVGGMLQTHANGEIMASWMFLPAAMRNPGVILAPYKFKNALVDRKPGENGVWYWNDIMTIEEARTVMVLGDNNTMSVSDIGLIGVITQSTCFIWRLENPVQVTSHLVIDNGRGTVLPANEAHTTMTTRLPRVGGKAYYSINVDKKDLFPKLRAKILEGVVTNEQKIKDIYGEAFDIVVKMEQFSQGVTTQHVAMWPIEGPQNKVHFTESYPWVHPTLHANYNPNVPYGVPQIVGPIVGNPPPPDPKRLFFPCMHAGFTQATWTGGSQFSPPWSGDPGVPMPVTCVQITSYSNYSFDGQGGAVTYPLPTFTFPIDKIPFKAVQIAPTGQKVGVPEVFGGFTPLADLTESASYTHEHDLSALIVSEIDAVDRATSGRDVHLSDHPGGSGPEAAAWTTTMTQSRNAERFRRHAVEQVLPTCTPITALILDFVNRWDDKVDELVGEEPTA